MDYWFWGGLPIFIICAWLYTSMAIKSFPTLRDKRILLLIAHPDDEAMFFAPVVQTLTDPSLNNKFKILCFSTGNADGLGETRKRELAKSAKLLGCALDEDVYCIDDSNFPDSQMTWNPTLLSNMLTQMFAPKLAAAPKTSAPPVNVDVIITFDKDGVSGHPNHKALHWGAKTWLKAIMHRHAGWEPPVTLYSLTSVNIARKYSWAIDSIVTMISATLSVMAEQVLGTKDGEGRRVKRSAKKTKAELLDRPSALLFINGPLALSNAQKAMVQAHKSQMVWFRWGWISIGRYMVINDLRRVRV